MFLIFPVVKGEEGSPYLLATFFSTGFLIILGSFNPDPPIIPIFIIKAYF